MKTKTIKNINMWLPIVALVFVLGFMGFDNFKDLSSLRVFQSFEATPGENIKKIEFVLNYENGLEVLERLKQQKVEQIAATKESQKRYERTLAMYPNLPILEIDKPIDFRDKNIDRNINYWIEYLEKNKTRYEAVKSEAYVLLENIKEKQKTYSWGKL
ncbi:hypothetical protein CRU98_05700 [Arcobacter sp. CECT 8986]|uniref:hypothetical protein n=1 Tax=Arcobacter sp. CECT 8986 TaxID=2044507 RepID=UPI0010098B61|nr:hypothetical protein [Arcobacter sp. CECT 8986]RXJ99521.1 hypothetical protein CRU98_05700 [Arcobacter sp. CECT 8986]